MSRKNQDPITPRSVKKACAAGAWLCLVLASCAKTEPVAVPAQPEPVTEPQETVLQLDIVKPQSHRLALVDGSEPKKLPQSRFTFGNGALVVGVLLPATRVPPLAESIRRGALLGLSDISPSYGIEIRFYDTGVTPETARLAYLQARADQVGVIVGPVFAANVARVQQQLAQDAQKRDTPVLLSLSSDPRLSSPEVISASQDWKGMMLQVAQAVKRSQKERVAVIYEANRLGRLLAAYLQDIDKRDPQVDFAGYYAFEDEASDLRQVITTVTDYQARRRTLDAYRDQLTSVQASLISPAVQRKVKALRSGHDIDGLVILSASSGVLHKLHAELEYVEIVPGMLQIFGITPWQEKPELLGLRLFNQSLMPIYSPPHLDVAVRRYQKVYGVVPSLISLQVYDLVRLIALTGSADGFASDQLFAQRGVIGALGLFRFRDDRTIERQFAMGQVRNGTVEIARAMPSNFDTYAQDSAPMAPVRSRVAPEVQVEPVITVPETEILTP